MENDKNKTLSMTIGRITNISFAQVEHDKDIMRENNRKKFADSKWLKVVTTIGNKEH